MNVVVVTQNGHLTGAFDRALRRLRRTDPDVNVTLEVAAEWAHDETARARCVERLERADIVLVAQIFIEAHETPILPTLTEHRDRYRALCCILSSPPIASLTRMGAFSAAEGEASPLLSAIRKLRGRGRAAGGKASGRHQMTVLKNLPRLLRLIPGAAQDLRAYLIVMRYWLAGSDENLANLVRFLVARYGGASRAKEPSAPKEYPTLGVYHPDLPGHGLADDASALPGIRSKKPRVGLLLMRSHLLSGNTHPYDAVIRGLEARGIVPVPAFAANLNQAPTAEAFFLDRDGQPTVDAVVSLTGFSLVGGPAYSDVDSAHALLERLDVPYIVAQPLELQSVEAWKEDPRGLSPLQASLMVSIPELDGATDPIVFGGRSDAPAHAGASVALDERVERLAERVARRSRLRRAERAERKVGIVLFNFPQNAATVGTAAFLDVFASLHRTLVRLADEGYDVEVPESVEALRAAVLQGNRERYGTPANVMHRVDVDDHVARCPWLDEIESVWGAAPGRQLVSGRHLLVMGARFGNVVVGVQPPMGWEGDPMRLLFERTFAPTHAFAAFYRWLHEDFGADALLHFGTHGATEFMPGKQVGLGEACWPDRLIGDTPNFYLYAANNPSEGALAKRRVAATLVTYLTPPVVQAGLYRQLADLRSGLERLRDLDPSAAERPGIEELVREQAAALELPAGDPLDPAELARRLSEIECALIPHGLHVLGAPPDSAEALDLLVAAGLARAAEDGGTPAAIEDALPDAARLVVEGRGERPVVSALVRGGVARGAARTLAAFLIGMFEQLSTNQELDGVVRALEGRWMPPAPAGDLIRRPEILPTGRNMYAFDPYRVPSAPALVEGRLQADRVLEAHRARHGDLPRTVALVLWGTDNLKRDGAPIAQALALIGAEPRFDSYGRLAGASLVPLERLGRPRIDVLVTVSGVFRDLMPLQMKLLAEASRLAACADEPPEQNWVRAHALDHARALGCTVEEASLRVFSNADRSYGANVNQSVDAGLWEDEAELGEMFVRRKSWAYDADGSGVHRAELLDRALAGVELTYQNLDSVELGVSDVDQYFDSLGGLSRAAANRRDEAVPVYIGDETRPGSAAVRTLDEQIDLESRTRVLNPRWYEAMLEHGYQGVREIESRVTAAVGWSATTGAVSPWVYRDVSRTFLLDPDMRRRLSRLNPDATLNMNRRVLEAFDRGYWEPTPDELAALEQANEELEDRIEGIDEEAAA